jgi:hypothetical protein
MHIQWEAEQTRFAALPSSVKFRSRLLTGGYMANLNGHFGSMLNKYHLARCNCMVQGIAHPIMCNMSKPQLCLSLCQTKVTCNTCPTSQWQFCPPQGKKYSMSLYMILLILLYLMFDMLNTAMSNTKAGHWVWPKTTKTLKFLDGLFAKWSARTICRSMTI